MHFETGRNPNFEAGAAASFRGAIHRLGSLPYKEQDFQAFIQRTRKVDQFRGQNFADHVPEFKSFFDETAASQKPAF